LNIPNLKMNDGKEIPQLGFGTFKTTTDEAYNSVLKALESGYRHIDTAAIYGNEEGVGNAIADSDVAREDIFLVSKVWNDRHGYDEAIEAFEETLKRLKTDYLDLYLIHWPKEKNLETWKALESLKAAGKIKSIGVSNFKIHHLEEIIENSDTVPAVNQVELHPQFQQEKLREYCEENGILIESWGPLMQGQIFDKETVIETAQKYSKTVAQVTIRWHLQKGFIVIPKSSNPERIRSNIDVFDFTLTDDDIRKIDTLNLQTRIGPDPDLITF